MKKYKKGKYILEHSIVPGSFGEPKDFFEVIIIKRNGELLHYPIMPPIRLHHSKLIFPPIMPYSQKEYKEILDNFIRKYEIFI